MKREQVTKAELAKILGVSAPMISKHARNGLFVKCTAPNGKLYLEDAKQAILYGKQRFNKVDKDIVKKHIPKELKESSKEDIKASDDLLAELEALIKEALTPTQKVQIVKDFWAGELNKQKFLRENKELISIAEVKSILDKIASPFSKHLDELPFALKSRYPDIKDEAFDWLKEHINSIKMDFQGIYD